MMWIGTDAGLSIYDGRKFTRFSLPQDMHSQQVWAIEEDPDGHMWFGTFGGGLLKYDGRNFTVFKAPDIINDHIRVLKYSHQYDCLLVGTQMGFSSISDDNIFSYSAKEPNGENFRVMSFLEDRTGIIFHTFSDGAYHFNPHDQQLRMVPDDSPLYVTSSSATFVSTRGDTVIGVGKTGLRIVGKDGVKEFGDIGQVFDIKEDKRGVLWIAAWSFYDMPEPGGLYTYDGQTLRFENDLWGMQARMLFDIFIDPATQTVFVASTDNGFYKLINKGIVRYPASFFGIGNLDIYDLLLYDNNLWITAYDHVIFGTQERGFNILDQNYFARSGFYPGHYFDSLYNIPMGRFLSMYVDAENNLFIGANRALFKKTDAQPGLQRFQIGPRMTENFVVLPDGKMISGSGIFRVVQNIYTLSPDNLATKSNPNLPKLSSINQVLSRGNELWLISSSHGLSRMQNDDFKMYHSQHPWLPQNLSAACLDVDNHIVAGSNDGKVLILEGSDTLSLITQFDNTNGLTGNQILWLFNDSGNRLWVGTNRGINIISSDSIDEGKKAHIRFVNGSEGLPELSIRKVIQDQEGIIWLGGQENLIRIDPGILLESTSDIQKVELTGFDINFKEMRWDSLEGSNVWRNVPTEKVILRHQQNSLTFSYTTDNVLNPEKVMYSYQIDGFTKEPSRWSNTGEVTFSNLPPGDYTLQVNAFNLHSGVKYEPLRLKFSILSPWWKTWYFYTLLIFFLILVILLVMRYRVLRIKKTEQLKLANEKRLNSIRIQAAQAQMNPHFVFNVLSSIQCFMLDNDMDSTLEYLNDFSSLIRTTMENMSAETILLSDEINYLQRYIKMESLRLGHDMTHRVCLGHNLLQKKLRLPPMIVQPFVENAIKHGLAAKKGQRLLYLGFHIQGTALRITICDNGIGMQHIKQTQILPKVHESRGIKNTFERIRYFTSNYNADETAKFGVMISNRQRNGKIKGVRVEIKLPLISEKADKDTVS